MENLLYYISFGAALGASAGYAPGPMTALVLGETIKGGRASGIAVSFSPLITDIPIIALIMLIYTNINVLNSIIPVISFFGAVYLVIIGLKQLKLNLGDIEVAGTNKKSSLIKGVYTNFLNPHPYLFWAVIGSPIILKAYSLNPSYALIFLVSFYACLVGSKISMTFLMDIAAARLDGKILTLLNRLTAFLLIGFGFSIFYDGFDALLKIIGK